jgi:hypothetical protein
MWPSTGQGQSCLGQECYAPMLSNKKLLQIFFKKIKENCTMLDRFIPTREALVHSIPISEVKDMKSDVLWALMASLFEKNFEPCLRPQF